MKEGKEPLRTFSDLMQFYQYQSSQDAPATTREEADGPSRTVDSGQKAEQESGQCAMGGGQTVAVSQPEPAESVDKSAANSRESGSDAAEVEAETPHGSNGAEQHGRSGATEAAPDVSNAPADSTA